MIMFTPDQIKAVRNRLGLSSRKFADVLGVSVAAVSRWESGHRHPTYKMMLKLNELMVGRKRLVDASGLSGRRNGK